MPQAIQAQPANYYAGFSVETFGQEKVEKVKNFAKACFQAIANFGILLYNLVRFQDSNGYRTKVAEKAPMKASHKAYFKNMTQRFDSNGNQIRPASYAERFQVSPAASAPGALLGGYND